MRILPTLLLMALLPLPLSFASRQSVSAAQQSGVSSAAKDGIPTVDFCEMVKHPKLYFDKAVRLTATYEMGVEAQYLSDVRCVLSHDDQIGTRYVNAYEKPPQTLRSYGGNTARVRVIGILRNSSLRGFAWYRYRFDIIRFEDVSHQDVSRLINSYEGTLQEGLTYRATVRGDKTFGLSLIPDLKIPFHQAVRVEWINLKDFPALERLRERSGQQRQIVFSVVSAETTQMTERRWNRVWSCKIITVE